MNDDIIYDVYHIHNYLNELVKNPTYNSSGELLAGALFRAGKPSRNKTSKWYVPMEEYSESVYPDYVSGWFYITNLLTSKYIAKEAQKTPFFWIDDVFVTGIIRQNLQINLLPLKSWITFEKGALECCIEIAKTYSYYCDYKVGPIGSERGFMCKFQHAMEKCHLHQCIPRPPKTALNVLCGNIAAYSKIA
ncbi:beta-1,3-galactosyltransferase bre-2-like [Teleopsis dalmanni]|uniref:beta-1,3-galactosyltransferase bre-2-like n=1 Tax=Teleopsis dalmanni TaxID=139649 RepID=UPI0018CC830B|nr:beta-1,3-galactosyltransferase bre-2-like [Teleopsis dalmanni]